MRPSAFEQNDKDDNIPAASSELRMVEAEELINNPWNDVREATEIKTLITKKLICFPCDLSS